MLEDRLREASERPTSGWDFSWLGSRMQTSPLPWRYAAILTALIEQSSDLLDLGTGGGERLAALVRRPPNTVATEAWEPNVAIAAKRLQPLGVPVVHVTGAPDNVLQSVGQCEPALPFRDGAFHVVASRHESFVATEVARVLAPGGRFVTQQLGDGVYADFRAWFGDATGGEPFTASIAVDQLVGAGLRIERCETSDQTVVFTDAAALAWYLRMVPWIVPGFSIEDEWTHLRRIEDHIQRDGALEIAMPAFVIEATKV